MLQGCWMKLSTSRAAGPHGGLLIHGFELEGSSELAPGTRIYQGGGVGVSSMGISGCSNF